MHSKTRKLTTKYGIASQRTLSILAIFDQDLDLISITMFKKYKLKFHRANYNGSNWMDSSTTKISC